MFEQELALIYPSRHASLPKRVVCAGGLFLAAGLRALPVGICARAGSISVR
jgi:hypothetical protein